VQVFAKQPENGEIEVININSSGLQFDFLYTIGDFPGLNVGQNRVKIDNLTTDQIYSDPEEDEHIPAFHSFEKMTGSVKLDVKKFSIECG